MKQKKYILLILFLLIINLFSLSFVSSVAGENELYVDSSYKGYSDGTAEKPYKTIQEAIDLANTDDTIYVFGGDYDETLIVDKKITIWGSIDGEPSIIDTRTDKRYTVEITADYAEFQDFTLQDARDYKSSPIGALIAVKANNVIVSGNYFNDTDSYGLYLDNSGDGSVVSGNSCNNTKRGICVESSDTNDIFNNHLENCTDTAIHITGSSNSRLYGNTVKTSLNGLSYISSSNINISTNDVASCDYYGIYLENIQQGIIKNNTIHDNAGGGLYLETTSVIVKNNTFDANERGILLVGSQNQIISNVFGNQTAAGIYAQSVSSNNVISENKFRDNGKTAQDDNHNTWSLHQKGNYWSDYDNVDRNHDGIGDVAYTKNGIDDQYPLGYFLKPPHKPSDPSPSDTETGVGLKITFKVKVTDDDSDQLTVSFYQYKENETDYLIGTDKRVNEGETAECQYTQPFDTTFLWYVVVNDSILENTSDIWYFTTMATPPDNQPPVADTGGPYTAKPTQSVFFDASQSTDPDGSIDFYRWNFGDGSSEILAKQPTHTYPSAGTYTVTLTVIDNDGTSDTKSTTATITGQVNTPPIADAGGPYTGKTKKTITFSGINSTDTDGTITNYTWNFGDGEIGYNEITTHTYSEAKTYLVYLTVTDNDGESNSAQTTVTITKQKEDTPGFELILLILAGFIILLTIQRKRKNQ